MKFEVTAAYIMGVALPLLEVLRRRTHFDNIPTYVDDFIIGGLLLYAAHAVTRRHANGRVLLVAAWAVLCGGFYNSFFGQLTSTAALDVSGFSNACVAIVKGLLYAVAIACLVLSIRAAAPAASTTAEPHR